MFRVILTYMFHCYTIHNNWNKTHKGPFTTTNTFNGPLSGTTRVSQYQKGKTNLDITEARDNEWPWHQLGHVQVCILLQTDQHPTTRFFSNQMPFLPPNQQCQCIEGIHILHNAKIFTALLNSFCTAYWPCETLTQNSITVVVHKLTFRQWFHKQQVSSISSEH